MSQSKLLFLSLKLVESLYLPLRSGCQVVRLDKHWQEKWGLGVGGLLGYITLYLFWKGAKTLLLFTHQEPDGENFTFQPVYSHCTHNSTPHHFRKDPSKTLLKSLESRGELGVRLEFPV